MPPTPADGESGPEEALGPETEAATQSAATQDLDRRLQELTDEHKAKLQALEAAMETRRQELLLASGPEAATTTPER